MADDPIERLAKGLGRFPGVGPKSARRIALDVLTWETDEVRRLADLLVEIKTNVKPCSTCFNLAVDDPCSICTDARRDTTTIMVVDAVANLIAVERTNSYRGVYHVLGGRLSPLDGIGPDDLKIAELEVRVSAGAIREVILANEPTVEGDATAQYLSQILSESGVQITQIARGLPVGSDLSLADQVTLSRALEGRREL
jgi:recombination protein RecR